MKAVLALSMAVMFAGIGCASSRSGRVYSRGEARRAHVVQTGVVGEVREVTIEGTKSGVGTVAGGVLGGVVGSTIGRGRGRRLATAGGAVAGAAAGAAAEEGATRRPGLEIEVTLDDGRTLVIVQEADIAFSPGDRVRVVRGEDGTHRVRK